MLMTMLCIVVDVAEDVLCGMITENSIGDGMDDFAHLIPQILLHLCHHCKQLRATNEEEGGGERHISCSLLRANFFSMVNF